MLHILKRQIIALVLLSCTFSLTFANQEKQYEEGKLYRHVLNNGLTVLTMERNIAPLIYHQISYKVGSRNEVLGKTGISHAVEHMMFKGTKKYNKGKATKLISENSGIFNAFTMRDITAYYEYMPANKIELALDLESDRMMNCIFDESEFKSEMEVIKQERRMRVDSNPRGIFSEALYTTAYKSHPIQYPIIGWPADLDHITRDEAYEYYKTYYTPNNATLVLVGGFETESMMELVKKYYEKIPRGPEIPEYYAIEEEQKVEKTFTLYHNDITSPLLKMAFHTPHYNHIDSPALRVAGMILCSKSRGSRLNKVLVRDKQLANSVSGGFGITKDPALFTINLSFRKDENIDEAEKVVWREIEKMQNEPVSDYELQKVKNRYRFNQVVNYGKNVDIGRRISKYETYYGWDTYQEFFDRIMLVTKEDIMNVMRKYFNPRKVTKGYQMPKTSDMTDGYADKSLETSSNAAGNDEGDAFYFKSPCKYFEVSNNPEGDEFKDVLLPKPIANHVNKFTLDNGLTVYTIENHLNPSLSVKGYINTGMITEDINEGKTGISDFLASVMNRGTENQTYNQLIEEMDFVPFSFKVAGGYKGFSFQGFSLIDDKDDMMQTGLEFLTIPAFDNEQIDRIRKRKKSRAKKRLKTTSIRAFFDMYSEMFRDHPYSRSHSTVESISNITKESLVELREKYFRPERTTLLMVGDMSPEEMRDLADKYFGQWRNDIPDFETVNVTGVKELEGKEIKVFNDNDYKQSTINIGFAPYNNIPVEEETIDILNYILASSTLTSRIGVDLRGKQGLIYGIKSELWVKKERMGYWKFNTKTAPENTEKVILGVFKHIKELLENRITDEELRIAKKHYLGLLPFYIETPDDIARIIFDCIRNDVPFDHFDKRAERILAVTKENVLEAAKKYFTLDRFRIAVDGPIKEGSLDHVMDKL